MTKCAAEKVAQKHLDEIEGNTKEDGENTDKTEPVTVRTVEGKKSVDGSGTKDQGGTDGNSQDGTDGNSAVDETAVMDFISERVNALMEHMPSPETQPVLVGAGKTAEEKIPTLLRCGAIVVVVAPTAREPYKRGHIKRRFSGNSGASTFTIWMACS